MLSLATEAMRATINSRFGAELDAIWQSVIDYRDRELTGSISFENKTNCVQNFFYKNCAKKFMEVVYKYTGLNVEAVFFKPWFQTEFCTWSCIQKGDEITAAGTHQIASALNGQAGTLLDGMIPQEFTVDELFKIAKSYDVEKGIIKPEFRNEMKKFVKVAIGFDISLGFLMEDFLPKNSGIKNFTARDLTAIMLHECGHTLTLIEHAADMYAHISSFEALQRAFSQKADLGKALELTKKTVDFAAKAGYTKDAGNLAAFYQRAEKDCLTAGKNIDQKGKYALTHGLINCSCTLLKEIFATAFDVAICDPNMDLKRHGEDKKFKFGDLQSNERMWTWQERKADEYAFDHGYGAELVEGLEKADKFYQMLGRSKEEIQALLKAERDQTKLSIGVSLGLIHAARKFYRDVDNRIYPPGAERYKEILRLTIRELKANGANADYVNKYTADCDRIIKAIYEQTRASKYFDLAVARYKSFLKYTSIPSFIQWLVNGRVEEEIEQLIADVQILSNNTVSYYGSKLEQLAKKGK